MTSVRFELPPHIDPLQLQPEEYAAYVSRRNMALHQRASVLLEELGIEEKVRELCGFDESTEESRIGIVSNGSDGRGENCSSPLEPIILLEKRVPLEIALKVRKEIDALLSSVQAEVSVGTEKHHGPSIALSDSVFDPVVELKVLEDGSVARYRDEQMAFGDYWPSRVTDTFAMLPDRGLLARTRLQMLLEEIRTPQGKKMIEREDRRRGSAGVICAENGMQKFAGAPLNHFDLQQGIATYTRTHDGPNQRSFKYGPLRLVQHTLQAELLRYLSRTDEESAKVLLLELPRETRERLLLLQDRNVLGISHVEAERLSTLYVYFLQLYHLSEFQYLITSGKQSVVELPDSGLAQENIDELAVKLAELRRRRPAYIRG